MLSITHGAFCKKPIKLITEAVCERERERERVCCSCKKFGFLRCKTLVMQACDDISSSAVTEPGLGRAACEGGGGRGRTPAHPALGTPTPTQGPAAVSPCTAPRGNRGVNPESVGLELRAAWGELEHLCGEEQILVLFLFMFLFHPNPWENAVSRARGAVWVGP